MSKECLKLRTSRKEMVNRWKKGIDLALRGGDLQVWLQALGREQAGLEMKPRLPIIKDKVAQDKLKLATCQAPFCVLATTDISS